MPALGLALALALAPAPEASPDEEEDEKPFFDPAKTEVGGEEPPEEEPEEREEPDEPRTPEPPDATPDAPKEASSAPPMPPIEELPNKSEGKGDKPPPLFDFGPKDRPPAGSDGGSFFDPGKIAAAGSSGGGLVQVRGFVAADFLVSMRTDTQRRESDGRFRELKPLPFFNLRSATLYIGAPIYADVVYARIGFEFLSVPTQTVLKEQIDVIPQARRFVAFESGAIEINPFAGAKRTQPWFREGFKLTAGVFIVPFGIEDEEHAAPINWFITRAYSMTTGRVYPGTWSDVGAMLKWKPTFKRNEKPIRPVELDIGVVNGDACSQTRFVDQLFTPSGLVARCERVLRQAETDNAVLVPDDSLRFDAPGGFVLPDNNGGKSVVARAQFFPIPALNFGGSFVWGVHPEGGEAPQVGEGTADLKQAPTWRSGAHLEVAFDDIFGLKVPLPTIRGEFVYGRDEAVQRSMPTQVDRTMMGGYVQIAQMLFRRKKTRLPGLILQYRFDHADPDIAVPGVIDGVPVGVDWSDAIHLRESAVQSHTFGLRFPVLPRFTLKTEYVLSREDGGRRNQLYNDLFGLEIVADF